jgi:hypothetical protein
MSVLGLREPPDRDEPHGWVFRVSLVIGWALIAFGVWKVLDRAGSTHPIGFGAWFLGLTLVHDLLVAPAVSAAAVLLVPRLPPRVRGVVLVAAIVSAVLVLLSLPPLLGDPADNESLLPRNYLAGLAVAIGVTWAVAGVWFLAASARRRRPT